VDDNYHSYLNRVAKLTMPATYTSQVNNLQESPKFKLQSHQRVPESFPGYSVITPPAAADVANQAFYQNLQDCQQQLAKSLEPDLIALVAPESLHLTIADLIWDQSYTAAVNADADFEVKLRQQITESFKSYQDSSPTPVRWQIMGLMLRPRAIAISLVPCDENSYDRVTAFRRTIYQNPGLMALSIEQQYYFTAHITIAYFGNVAQTFDRPNFSHLLQDINLQWIDKPQEMSISPVELRHFSDMTSYHREADWPVVNL
jgi:hypothetical protein